MSEEAKRVVMSESSAVMHKYPRAEASEYAIADRGSCQYLI